MRTKLALLGWVVALAVASVFGATNETAWKAGVASVPITPDQPMWMAGYASRTNVSQGKATELYAKALALDDTRGARLVIVTLDLIGVPRALRAGLEAAVGKEHGLPREGLLMNCSHTHSGPEFRMRPGSRDWAMFGKEGIPGAKSGAEYGRELQTKLIDLVRRALVDRVPAKLSYHHARCGFAMNRRTPVGTNYNNFPNPDGPVDHVPSARMFREGGYEPHTSIFFSEIHPGPWAPSLEERIIGKVHALNDGLRCRDR